MDETTKPWWLSRTILASIVGIGAGLVGVAKIEIDAQTQAQIVDWVIAAVPIIAGIGAIIGRIKAKSGVHFKKPVKDDPKDDTTKDDPNA